MLFGIASIRSGHAVGRSRAVDDRRLGRKLDSGTARGERAADGGAPTGLTTRGDISAVGPGRGGEAGCGRGGAARQDRSADPGERFRLRIAGQGYTLRRRSDRIVCAVREADRIMSGDVNREAVHPAYRLRDSG